MSTNWNPSKPASGEVVNLFPAQNVNNMLALEDAIGREHNFPGNQGSDAGQHAFPVVTASPAGAEGRLAIVNDLLSWYSNGAWHNNRDSVIPQGTKMLFMQASAPTGWTQDTSLNDRVLRLVSGSGGVTGGSWTLSGVTVDGHSLTGAEMNHSHGASYDYTQYQGSVTFVKSISWGVSASASPHTHGLTSDSNWRPSYVDIIAAAKD